MSLYMSSTQIYLDGLHGNTRFVFRAGGTEKFQVSPQQEIMFYFL